MDALTQAILAEAEAELSKEANDANGAPEAPANASQEKDVATIAQEYLNNVAKFKESLNVAAGNNGQQEEVEQVDENGQPVQQNAGDNVNVQTENVAATPETGTIIQTPGGSIIKLAALALVTEN